VKISQKFRYVGTITDKNYENRLKEADFHVATIFNDKKIDIIFCDNKKIIEKKDKLYIVNRSIDALENCKDELIKLKKTL